MANEFTETRTSNGFIRLSLFESGILHQTEQSRHEIVTENNAYRAYVTSEVNRIDLKIDEIDRQISFICETFKENGRHYTPAIANNHLMAASLMMLCLEIIGNAGGLSALYLPEMATWAFAAIIAIASGVLAMMTARLIRAEGWAKAKSATTILAAAGNALLLGLFIYLAYIRARSSDNPNDHGGHDPLLAPTILMVQLVAYAGLCALDVLALDPNSKRHEEHRNTLRLEGVRETLLRRRAKIAAHFNRSLSRDAHRLSREEHYGLHLCSQFRDGNARGRGINSSPEYFKTPLTMALYKPIALGNLLDIHPRTIGATLLPHPPLDEE